MTPYKFALLVHLFGTLTLFMAIAVQWVCLSRLRRAGTGEQLREWAGLIKLADRPLPLDMLTILASGLYMIIQRHWTVRLDWIALSLTAVLVMGLVGRLVNMRRLGAIAGAAEHAPSGPIAPVLLRQVQDPVLLTSVQTLAMLAFGVVALKALRPEPLAAVATLAVAVAVGLASAQLPQLPWLSRRPARRRRPTSQFVVPAALGSGS